MRSCKYLEAIMNELIKLISKKRENKPLNSLNIKIYDNVDFNFNILILLETPKAM
jgi:hypothetical protein